MASKKKWPAGTVLYLNHDELPAAPKGAKAIALKDFYAEDSYVYLRWAHPVCPLDKARQADGGYFPEQFSLDPPHHATPPRYHAGKVIRVNGETCYLSEDVGPNDEKAMVANSVACRQVDLCELEPVGKQFENLSASSLEALKQRHRKNWPVGTVLYLRNNAHMAAPLGAKALVARYMEAGDKYVKVTWRYPRGGLDKIRQSDGEYSPEIFQLTPVEGAVRYKAGTAVELNGERYTIQSDVGPQDTLVDLINGRKTRTAVLENIVPAPPVSVSLAKAVTEGLKDPHSKSDTVKERPVITGLTLTVTTSTTRTIELDPEKVLELLEEYL